MPAKDSEKLDAPTDSSCSSSISKPSKSTGQTPSLWTMTQHALPLVLASGLIAFLSVVVKGRVNTTYSLEDLPPQSVYLDPKSFLVLGPETTWRQSPLSPPWFNPTNTSSPFFQIFHEDFLSILGENPSIFEIASNDTYAFAHEAPIYVPETRDVWFSANGGGDKGFSDWDHNNKVGKINLDEVEKALRGAETLTEKKVNATVTMIESDALQMTNGGTGPYKSDLLFITSGRQDIYPPSIVRMNPKPPYNTTVLLNNFYGRQFNSLNDIKVHPTSGKLFFTDTIYGYINRFRPSPLLPNQVYSLDPDTGSLRVVADGFGHSNGIAFSEDGKTAYIADTGLGGGSATDPATIYAFDVSSKTGLFTNRRVFAFIDAGIPDGVQVDTAGNVYSGCGDGVHVWNSEGVLLGKFFINTTSANMVFAGDGELIILAETKVYLARIAAKGFALSPI